MVESIPAILKKRGHHKIRHLPVFSSGELLGVVSMGELVNAVIADQAFKIDQLMAYVGHK
jgi:CBS domain-containing protein